MNGGGVLSQKIPKRPCSARLHSSISYSGHRIQQVLSAYGAYLSHGTHVVILSPTSHSIKGTHLQTRTSPPDIVGTKSPFRTDP